MPDDTDAAQSRIAKRLAVVAAVLWLPLAALFIGWSDIDLAASRLFYTGSDFIGHRLWWSEPLRYAFQAFYAATIGLALAGLWRTRTGGKWLARPRFAWIYLLACLLIGPILVTHGLFKMSFGRPRPMEITEFGGSKTFKAAFAPSPQCTWGCSFVSGETSSTFIPFLAAAVLAPQAAPILLVGGTVVGLSAGGVRMLQGRHFLSDVLFAALAMALVAALTLPLARRIDRAISARSGRADDSPRPRA